MMDPGLADYHLGGDNDRGGVMSLSGFGIDQGVDDRSTFDMMDSFAPSQSLFDDADTAYFDRSHMSMDLGPEPEVSPLMPSMSSFRTASATSPVPNKVRRAPAPTIVPPHPTHVTRGGKSAPKTRDPTGAQQWVDPETVMCEQCGSGDNAQELLICDGCNKGRHTYCLPYALTLEQVAQVPKWYCPACVLSRAKLKQKSNVYLRKYYTSVTQKIKRDKSQPTLEQALAQGMLFVGEEDEEDDKGRKALTASSETGKKRVPAKKSVEQTANNKRKKSTRRGSESEESDEDEEERPVRKRRALTSSNSGTGTNTPASTQSNKKSPGQVASVKPQVTGVIASTAPAPSTQNIDAVFLSLVPLPNRMPLPQLHFRDKTLSELYDRVPSQTYECLDWHDFRIEFLPQQSSVHTPLSLTHQSQSQAAFNNNVNYNDWPVKAQPGPPRDMDVKPKKEMMPGPGLPPGPGSYAPPPVKPQPGMTSHPINFPVPGPPTSPFAPPSPYGTAPSYPFDQSKPPGPSSAPYPAPFPGAGYPKAPMNPTAGPNYFPNQNPAMNGPNTAPGPMMINPQYPGAPSHVPNPQPEPHSYQSPNSVPMNYPSPPKPGPASNQGPARSPQGVMPSAVNTSAPGPYPTGTAPLPSRPSNMKWHNNVAPSPNPPPIPPNPKNPARLIWNQAVTNPAGYRPGPMPPTAGTMPPNRTGPSQPYLTAPAQNVPKQIPMNPDQRPM
eukprot:TRINITY_DN4235_c0_g1_i1.p1 TRINITY_DN4235_c0_g1~~TRINITY_DN4235_c0_g1_i1.p1  ORF type:complete len:721 (-),score=222.70 TRINITY_DN4235_c0_g1_i1:70-2232(-)